MTKKQEREIDKRKEELGFKLSCELITDKEREKLDAEYDSLPETTKDRALSKLIDDQEKERHEQRIHNFMFNKELYALEVELPLDYFTPFNIRQIQRKGFVEQENNLFILSFPLEQDRDIWSDMIRMNLASPKQREINKKHIIKKMMVPNEGYVE